MNKLYGSIKSYREVIKEGFEEISKDYQSIFEGRSNEEVYIELHHQYNRITDFKSDLKRKEEHSDHVKSLIDDHSTIIFDVDHYLNILEVHINKNIYRPLTTEEQERIPHYPVIKGTLESIQFNN